jgi:hypothetical protein
MPTVVIDGIATRYEVIGSGPPLLMYAPGGFNAVAEAWSTLGIYQKIKLLDHLPAHFSCILFDRRECGHPGGRVEPITWRHYVAQGKGLLEHYCAAAPAPSRIPPTRVRWVFNISDRGPKARSRRLPARAGSRCARQGERS